MSESVVGNSFPPMSDPWAAILRSESPLRFAQRAGRRAFAIAPGSTRCKLCNAPFTGPSAAAFKLCGYGQSRKNPQLCGRCVESAPEGGAVVPLAILFADMRGYTSLTERLGAIEATALVNRFYEVASKAFLPLEGLLGQIAGDEVMAIFVPGLAGRTYREKAVQAGASLLDAAGYGKSTPSWIDVGVGIASGEEFVGNVGRGRLQGLHRDRGCDKYRREADVHRAGGRDLARRGHPRGRCGQLPGSRERVTFLEGQGSCRRGLPAPSRLGRTQTHF